MVSHPNLFKALSGPAMILSIFPLIWHIKTRNLPAICLVSWLFASNLMNFTNAFIWSADKNIYALWDGKIFCDVEVKIIIAAGVGKICGLAAISRNLAGVMKEDRAVVKTRGEKRRERVQDLVICFGLPVWTVCVHYFVQPDRYWLLGVQGCTPSIDNSWPSIVLEFIWPPIAALAAVYYSAIVFIRLRRHRREFDQILTNSSSQSSTKSRFYRLYAYTIILVVVLLPVNLYILAMNLKVQRQPYSWSRVHGDEWKWIFRIPYIGEANFDRWIDVGAGILLFLFFGLGNDAMGMYREWLILVPGVQKAWERAMRGRKEKRRVKNQNQNWSETSDTQSGSFGNGNVNGTSTVRSAQSGSSEGSVALKMEAMHCTTTTSTASSSSRRGGGGSGGLGELEDEDIDEQLYAYV
ncbi:pheromone A receptor-domain-containing protein [Peziza echinospora]|nr:pheromone A receptor-domain-containing protein [Peziza echinospora]